MTTPPVHASPFLRMDAGCKINLYLEILRRRDDGYHELRTLFHPLPEPFDTLAAGPGEPGSGLVLACDDPSLAGESNIVCKAHQAYCKALGRRLDVRLELTKRIPMGAGLGGGSSDAACALTLFNRMAGNALSREAMHELATGLGADVPFFLVNTPCWARGIGEELTVADAFLDTGGLSGLTLVLACPDVHVSSGQAYGDWDRLQGAEPESAPRFLTSPGKTSKDTFLQRSWMLFNSFEAVVFSHHPSLRLLKERLLSLGAAGALMSGSGASVYGLFRNRETGLSAAGILSGELNIRVHAHTY